jgi:hypothetical protein
MAAAAAAILLMSEGTAHAAAKSCTSDSEYSSLSLRVLQSDLLVAGLRCRAHSQYNSFVSKFGGELQANGSALKKFFSARGGGRQLDQMVTRLANDASNRAGVDTHSYCAGIDEMFDEVLGINNADLRKYAAARPTAGSHGFKRCSTVTLAEDAMQIPGAKVGKKADKKKAIE